MQAFHAVHKSNSLPILLCVCRYYYKRPITNSQGFAKLNAVDEKLQTFIEQL